MEHCSANCRVLGGHTYSGRSYPVKKESAAKYGIMRWRENMRICHACYNSQLEQTQVFLARGDIKMKVLMTADVGSSVGNVVVGEKQGGNIERTAYAL